MPSDAEQCAIVVFSGEATVRTINDAYRRVCEALQQSDGLVVDAGQLDDVDLAFVQLLESSRRTAARESKRVCLAAPASGQLRALLERGGFFNQAGTETREFWLQETGGK